MILDNQYYVKTNSDLGVCNKMQLALCSWSLYSNLLVVTLGNLALSINQSINRLFVSDQCTLARSFKFSQLVSIVVLPLCQFRGGGSYWSRAGRGPPIYFCACGPQMFQVHPRCDHFTFCYHHPGTLLNICYITSPNCTLISLISAACEFNTDFLRVSVC